jgi:hypothetical protein
VNAETGVRIALKRALESLDAAVGTIDSDVEAATDDLLAARLLVATALAMLGPEMEGHEDVGGCASRPPPTSIPSPPRRRKEPPPMQCS